jgi:hypothetical protein
MASVRALNAGLESRRLHIGMLPSPISLPSHTKFLCALDVALLELQQLQRITLQMQHLCCNLLHTLHRVRLLDHASTDSFKRVDEGVQISLGVVTLY